ncbi:dolichyl-phosphate-mannose--protein mannosyltransferase [Pseudoxanthomonas broegbernensis]|uniref:Dolichyl-phosphate-mannose--protein mannosyltransferase n=1 Tax=Pseudoxanthomonas broegbernensis TaxID=83619 RepID=A0A7V8K699_9GAMM|nr:glycosyltransferase family 39 protein [Pseudoxanthomonas broegbernensis]KAF1685238.1 dolichyl-phosphate-mannose--protein mannosyltransferase [Pseudoxanthomonas broegbernensis]MBB6066124.1 4-amino-4-deoxy-L-arabinose transferase-like glycosyltransferase [Pseudoxanthomonas broegbernensis]
MRLPIPRSAPVRDALLLWLTALLVLGAGLGLRDPWPADEPRFALVARQMVESGNWLFPHRGIELYSDKPPMLMWLQAAFHTLTGSWRVAFLLPSLLAALGTLWCVQDLGRRLWTRKVGLYAAWALLFAFQFTWQAKKAQIDPLVTFFITLANYGLLRHLLLGPDWRGWALGWFAAGIGTITKGVGVLALLMLVPAALACWRGWPGVRAHARDPRFWLGPLAFMAAVSLWLAPVLAAALSSGLPEHRAYLDDILFRQTAERYSRSWDHHQPPWYHLRVMATMWIPPALALPWALPAWWRRLRRRDPRYLLPLAWWGLVVVFFSLSPGKRDVYVMPALPMMCLVLAPLLPGLLRRGWARALVLLLALGVAVAFAAAGLSVLEGGGSLAGRLREERGLDAASIRAAGWMLLGIGAWGLGCALLLRRRATAALLAGLAGVWVVFGLVGYRLLNDASSARGLMAAVGQRIGPEAELGLVAWKEQNLLMADRPATNFGFKRSWDAQLRLGLEWQAQAPGRWLLLQEDALEGCIDRQRIELAGVANRRRWWLVPAGAAGGRCLPTAAERAAAARRQTEDVDE